MTPECKMASARDVVMINAMAEGFMQGAMSAGTEAGATADAVATALCLAAVQILCNCSNNRKLINETVEILHLNMQQAVIDCSGNAPSPGKSQ